MEDDIRCSMCKQSKPRDNFTPYHQQVREAGGSARCRECQSSINKRRNKGRPEKVDPKARQKMYRAKVAELKSAPCMDCGGTFPSVCMDFDHREPEFKVDRVSQLISNGYGWETIEAEIAKCDLVCANCHRIRTFITSPVAQDIRG